MYELYKVCNFESAHKLEGHPKCGKLHGHSYKVEVWIESKELNGRWKLVADFGLIKEIINRYDHSDKIITISCEELAREIYDKIENELMELEANWEDMRVRVWETPSSWAEYTITIE